MAPKHVPQRTCVGCRAVRAKRELVRIVRTPAGSIEVDPTGRRPGRGAYLCPNEACLNAAMKGRRLAHALEQAIPQEVVERLAQELARGASGQAGSGRA